MAVPTAQAPQNYYSKSPPGARPGPSYAKQMPVSPGAARSPSQNTGTATPQQSVKKEFDINLYFKAVGLFFNDFFGKKMPYFFQNMGPVMQNAPNWWNKLPQDEQISYGVMVFGGFLFVAGIVLFVVL
ncbi:MAG: hypothetical protein V1729_07315 [Candidatus Woesearchaeota archaeon]